MVMVRSRITDSHLEFTLLKVITRYEISSNLVKLVTEKSKKTKYPKECKVSVQYVQK